MSHLVKAVSNKLWFVNMGCKNKIWLIDWCPVLISCVFVSRVSWAPVLCISCKLPPCALCFFSFYLFEIPEFHFFCTRPFSLKRIFLLNSASWVHLPLCLHRNPWHFLSVYQSPSDRAVDPFLQLTPCDCAVDSFLQLKSCDRAVDPFLQLTPCDRAVDPFLQLKTCGRAVKPSFRLITRNRAVNPWLQKVPVWARRRVCRAPPAEPGRVIGTAKRLDWGLIYNRCVRTKMQPAVETKTKTAKTQMWFKTMPMWKPVGNT